MKKLAAIFLFFTIPGIIVTPVLARKAELINPQGIVIDDTTTTDLAYKAIVGAMLQSDWVKENEVFDNTNGIIEAAYHIRTHKILIKIKYNQQQISFHYLDSENMNYKKNRNKQFIHPNYTVWVQQLVDQIEFNVNKGSAYDFDQFLDQNTIDSQQIPTEPFVNFSNFRLDETTLAAPFQGQEENENAVQNLDHNLQLILQSKLRYWSNQNKPTRTLIIKPQIKAIRLIDSVARKWIGGWDHRLWVVVKLSFIDQVTKAVIAEPLLYRKGPFIKGASVSERESRMIKDMAADIRIFIENNYNENKGGGHVPPPEIRNKIM